MSEMPNTEPTHGASGDPKQKTNVWVAIIFIIIAVFFFAFIEPKVIEENGHDEEQTEETIESTDPFQDFVAGVPEGWPYYENAIEDIQSLTRGQVITHGIVQDPEDESIYYFAASAYDARHHENLVSIYRYDTSDYSFERLYRTTYARGGTILLGADAIAQFGVVGYDNGHLIILVQNREATIEPCDNFWLLGMERTDDFNLVQMDLLHPYDGFEEYTLPEEELNLINELEAVKDCN